MGKHNRQAVRTAPHPVRPASAALAPSTPAAGEAPTTPRTQADVAASPRRFFVITAALETGYARAGRRFKHRQPVEVPVDALSAADITALRRDARAKLIALREV